MESFTLPPRLKGPARAVLEVGCRSLVLKKGQHLARPLGVYILWWGQDPDQIHVLSVPVRFENDPDDEEGFRGVRVAAYNVVTGVDHFRIYLKDAKRLIMEIRDANDTVIGITAMRHLERVVDDGAVHQNVDVVSPEGTVLGTLSCYVTFDALVSTSTSPPASPEPPDPSPITSGRHRPVYNIPSRKPVTSGKPRVKSVTFSDKTIQEELDIAYQRSKKILSDQDPEHPRVSSKLPTWNLSTERLRLISQMNQLKVKVRSLRFRTELMDHIMEFNKEISRPKTKMIKRKLHSQKPHSFFVSYNVPPVQETTNLCGSRKSGNLVHRKEKNVIDFEGQTAHDVRFNAKMLDVWWVSNLEFKVLIRSFHQKTPNVIGSAFVGMKHLLIDEEFSSGFKKVHLPIFASSQFRQYYADASKSVPEIMGDLEVEFCLTNQVTKEIPSQTSSVECQAEKEMNSVSLDDQPSSKIISQESEIVDDSAYDPVTVESVPDVPRSIPVKKTLISQSRHFPQGAPVCICLLRVSEGEGLEVFSSNSDTPSFCKNCQCIKAKCCTSQLYVTCKMFAPENQATSELCQVQPGGKVGFDLQHSCPFPADAAFLEKYCQDNFLILEIWERRRSRQQQQQQRLIGLKKDGVPPTTTTDSLIGIATVPLNNLFLTFKDPNKIELAKNLEFPVIVANEWLPIVDIVSGSIHGNISVLLAAGFESQIHKLSLSLGMEVENPKRSKDPLPSPAAEGKDDEHDDEENTGSDDEEVATFPDQATTQEENVPEKSPLEGTSNERIGPNMIRLIVKVFEGRNLPRISTRKFDECKGKVTNAKALPNTYISLPPTYNDSELINGRPRRAGQPTSRLILNNCHPKWDMNTLVNCSTDLLSDPRRHFIVKVWHRPLENVNTSTAVNDHVLGFGAVDLTPLLRKDFQTICGWYNIIDFVGRIRGQIKVEITPQSAREVERLKDHGELSIIQSDDRHDDTIRDNSICVDGQNDQGDESIYEPIGVVSSAPSGRLSNEINSPPSLDETTKTTSFQEHCWVPPSIPTSAANDYGDTRSFLQTKLSELDMLSKRLHHRLNMEEQFPDMTTTTITDKPPTPNDIEGRSFEEIQAAICNQLNAMKNTLMKNTNIGGLEEDDPDSSVGLDVRSEDSDHRQSDIDFPDDRARSRMEPDGGNPSQASNNTS